MEHVTDLPPAQAHLLWNDIHIFQDPGLWRASNAVSRSRKLTDPRGIVPAEDAATGRTVIRLIQTDTFAAAQELHLHNPNDKIAVLSHANATVPGGGFIEGSIAQEEDLCHCSNLYETLNLSMYPIRPNQLIYSPDILVTRSKVHGTNTHADLPRASWFYVNVISCAAVRRPRLRYINHNNVDGISEQRATYANLPDEQLMFQKLQSILNVASQHNVRRLVLGAFGCGVFGNPVSEVARMMKRLLVDGEVHGSGPGFEGSRYGIHEIVIAIYDPAPSQPIWNAFLNEFRVGGGLHATDERTGVTGATRPPYLQATIFPPGYAFRLDQIAYADTPSSLSSEMALPLH